MNTAVKHVGFYKEFPCGSCGSVLTSLDLPEPSDRLCPNCAPVVPDAAPSLPAPESVQDRAARLCVTLLREALAHALAGQYWRVVETSESVIAAANRARGR